jgi:poly(ADP-ribose) glycohydrolase ARH3
MNGIEEPLKDLDRRFVGALLGVAFGDALGAAVEGMSSESIRRQYGVIRDFLPSERGLGRYTDDTQMTLALALSMIRVGDVDGADCAHGYGELFAPERGYGRSAAAVLEALREGADYRRTGTMLFAGGSYGNGAAMRIAPVGLVFGHGNAQLLRQKVFEAVRCTHVHPEALDGAMVQALAVGLMASAERGCLPEPGGFADRLRELCRTDRLRRRMRRVAELLRSGATADEAARVIGTGIASAEAVPTAIFVALRHGEDPEEALVRAVALGGDTDTIAAMVGAVVGALHGAERFPKRWYETLENGPFGRDEIIRVARKLAQLAHGHEGG